jgi:hypothetical protein
MTSNARELADLATAYAGGTITASLDGNATTANSLVSGARTVTADTSQNYHSWQFRSNQTTDSAIRILGSDGSFRGSYYGDGVSQGFLNSSNGWVVRFNNGELQSGTVPVGRITGTLPVANGGTGNTTGNAATATALQTARTIGGVSFNGSANINLPGVNIAGNQNTSGTATTSTQVVSSSNSITQSSNQWLINSANTGSNTLAIIRTAGTNLYSFLANGVFINSAGFIADNTQATHTITASGRTAILGVRKNPGIDAASFVSFNNPSGNTNRPIWVDNSGILRISNTFAHIGTTSGTVVGAQTSDERVKNILGPVSYGLAEVMALEPVKYALKSDPEQVPKLGFVAQQVNPILPEVVYDTKEEIDEGEPTKLAMEYVAIIPVLVNAVKALKLEIDALKVRLDATGQ